MSRTDAQPAAFDGVSPALLSKAQVGKFLGGMSVASVERLHASGRLGPLPVRLGRLVRWRRDELEEWVAAGLPNREVWRQRDA